MSTWGGRFSGATDKVMEAFNASIGIDKRMWSQDIRGSIAYAEELAAVGLLTSDEASSLRGGLERIAGEWERGEFVLKGPSIDEDIHTANERRLFELVGDVAGKLHTGRSRNDQVATDMRLWLRDALTALRRDVVSLIRTAVQRAALPESLDALMPGFTHLQRAQPIRFSHWVLAHAWSWQRDVERLDSLREHMDLCPLGSGALAGNPFSIDRARLAASLGFERGPTQNSVDSVSDRDFIAEFLFVASLLGVHLSRFAEDLIVYSSASFGYVSLSDAYSTGSSLMPQKKNADSLELIRGKSSRFIGNLNTMLVCLKGLPSSYNKDLQEDKEAMFSSADTLEAVVAIARGVLDTLTIHTERMAGDLSTDMLATDLAEYLVRKGVPFRSTHHVAGRAVKLAESKGCQLKDLTLAELVELHPSFTEDVMQIWSMERSAESRASAGGTSRASCLQQIQQLKALHDSGSSSSSSSSSSAE